MKGIIGVKELFLDAHIIIYEFGFKCYIVLWVAVIKSKKVTFLDVAYKECKKRDKDVK